MSITGAQVRAARALIRWTASDLAAATKLGLMTIRRAEAVDGIVPITQANASIIRTTLENEGVIFLEENGEGFGVGIKR